MTPTGTRKLGRCWRTVAANEDAVFKRPANRCAIAIPACIRYISGSSGLRRIARSKYAVAPSGSPFHSLRNPPRNHAAARFGLIRSALSIRAMPPSRSVARWPSACPLRVSATASSWPSSTARRANRAPSAISCTRSPIQPLTLRQKWHHAAIAWADAKIRIDLERLIELAQRLVGRLPGSPIQLFPSAQVVVVGVEAVGGLAL